MRKSRYAVLAVAVMVVLAAACISNPAEAGTLYVNDYPGVSNIGVTGYNGSAGEFQIGIGSSSNYGVGYCVDLSKTINVPGTYTDYTFTAASSQSISTQVAAWVISKYAPGLGNTGWYGSTSQDIALAAVQLAVWEITQETWKTTPYSLLNGTFKITYDPTTGNVVTTLATGILNNVYSTLYSGGQYTVDPASIANVSVAGSSSHQNLLTATAVPEPSSILLLGLGLAGLGFVSRRKPAFLKTV